MKSYCFTLKNFKLFNKKYINLLFKKKVGDKSKIKNGLKITPIEEINNETDSIKYGSIRVP